MVPFLCIIMLLFIDQKLPALNYSSYLLMALVLIFYAYNLSGWYDAIVYGVKPSLLGLTH